MKAWAGVAAFAISVLALLFAIYVAGYIAGSNAVLHP
jgi:hypothetical protein